MEHTRLLLTYAREDYSEAVNLLCLVQMHMIPVTIEDTMYAYMVALDWCEWIKNPKSSADNPLFNKAISPLSMLDIFENYVNELAKELEAKEYMVATVFGNLNPNLVQLWRSHNAVLKEDTKMYHRCLWITANLFQEKFENPVYKQILEQKQVPPMV